MIEHDFGVEVRKIDGSIDKDDAVNPLVNKERNLREFRTCDDVNVLIALRVEHTLTYQRVDLIVLI